MFQFKNLINPFSLFLSSLLILVLCACSQDEPGGNQKKPETLNLIFKHTQKIGDHQSITIREGYFYIDTDDNKNDNTSISCKILPIGKTESFKNVKSLPNKGWEGSAIGSDYEKGDSYILQFVSEYYVKFAALRIVDMIYSGKDPVGIKAEIIFPFDVPVRLLDTSIAAECEGGEYSVEFESPAPAQRYETPDWIYVTFEPDRAIFNFKPNIEAADRRATVKFGNSTGLVSVQVVQKGTGSDAYAGGDGSKENPYLVATATQFNRIRLNPDKHYRQTADIDLADVIKSQGGSWIPILNFSGSYDGGMHRIMNLEIEDVTNSDPNEYFNRSAALFTTAHNAEFHNIRLHIGERGINANEDYWGSSGICAAGICADGHNIKVSRCSVEGGIISNDRNNAYGVAEAWDGSIVSECYTNVTLSGSSLYGIANCRVENCYVAGNIDAYESGDRFRFASSIAFGNIAKNCYIIGKYTGEYMGYDTLTGEYTLLQFGTFAFRESDATSCYSLVETSEADMKRRATYVGWDFDNVWTIDEGVSYPRLRCFEK